MSSIAPNAGARSRHFAVSTNKRSPHHPADLPYSVPSWRLFSAQHPQPASDFPGIGVPISLLRRCAFASICTRRFEGRAWASLLHPITHHITDMWLIGPAPVEHIDGNLALAYITHTISADALPRDRLRRSSVDRRNKRKPAELVACCFYLALTVSAVVIIVPS